MRRNNAVVERVSAPSRGLITRIPSNLSSPDRRAIVVGENVRAEEGVLSAAPGYERIVSSPINLDSPANLIFQANILNQDPEVRNTPFIGTGSRLYTVQRRAKALTCDAGAGATCEATVGFLGDSGRVGSDLLSVSDLVKSWSPDFIIHLGDLVYADGVVDAGVGDYEECIGQYFGADYVGGYNGIYGVGPTENKFFPTLGNHDWDEGGIFNYLDFFSVAKNPNERYYHYKRGPFHFVHLNSGGLLSGSVDPDGYGLGSDQAAWLETVLSESDCPWLFVVVHFPGWTSDEDYYPGIASTQTLAPLFAEYGVTAVISGHSHNSELLVIPDVAFDGGTADVTQIVSGSGGHSLRGFNDPVSPYSVWGDTTHYAALRLDGNRTTATFQWIAVDGTVLHTKVFDNPRENSGICYVGDAAKEIFTLEVRPSTASVEVGATWAYRAYANYLDGTVADVTEDCAWTSSDDTIAVVGTSTGVAFGHAPGIITVTAEYQDVSATATLHVLHSCIDNPTEVIFCLSRAGSTGAFAGTSTRLEATKLAVETTIDAFDSTSDVVGLVSFAGTFTGQVEDSTLDATLTDDFDSVKAALSLLVPDGENGIASGLDTTYAELTSARHTSGNLRAVVLVVDWPADVVDGGDDSSEAAAITAAMAAAATSATAIKTLTSTTLVVFGYNIPSAYRSAISALATSGYYFDVSSEEELRSDMAGLPHILCYYGGDYYYYPPPEAVHCGNPVPDFQGLTQWDILRGTVDLAGVGPGGETDLVAWDPRPGNGLYLDLVGTNPDNAPAHDTTSSKIRTKDSFLFTAGKSYKLSFYFCHYAGTLPYVDVSIGNSGEVVAVTRCTPTADSPFTLHEISWVQGATATAPIIFDHQLKKFNAVTGTLLDRVKLDNVTDAVEMFYDDFDAENACEI